MYVYMYELPAMGGRRLTLPSQPLHHSSTPHRWQCLFRYVCAEEQLPAWSAEVPGTPEQLSMTWLVARRCLAPLNNYK